MTTSKALLRGVRLEDHPLIIDRWNRVLLYQFAPRILIDQSGQTYAYEGESLWEVRLEYYAPLEERPLLLRWNHKQIYRGFDLGTARLKFEDAIAKEKATNPFTNLLGKRVRVGYVLRARTEYEVIQVDPSGFLKAKESWGNGGDFPVKEFHVDQALGEGYANFAKLAFN